MNFPIVPAFNNFASQKTTLIEVFPLNAIGVILSGSDKINFIKKLHDGPFRDRTARPET